MIPRRLFLPTIVNCITAPPEAPLEIRHQLCCLFPQHDISTHFCSPQERTFSLHFSTIPLRLTLFKPKKNPVPHLLTRFLFRVHLSSFTTAPSDGCQPGSNRLSAAPWGVHHSPPSYYIPPLCSSFIFSNPSFHARQRGQPPAY
jgi:hypothetical protein